MEPSTHSDRLLDLLYGECSPEEEAELREAIADDEELADEWRQLREARRDVERHIPPPEDVPDDVCTSILDAAAQHAPNSERASSDRSPTAPDGLWTSFVDSGGLRIAASLCAVGLATAVLYIYYEGDVVDEAPPAAQYAMEMEEDAVEEAPLEHAFQEEAVDDAETAQLREAPDEMELDALELAEVADSEATELAEAIEAEEAPGVGEATPAGDADDGVPLIMAEGDVDAEAGAAPEERARSQSSAPQPRPQPQDRTSGGGAGGAAAGSSVPKDDDADDAAALHSLGRVGGLGDAIGHDREPGEGHAADDTGIDLDDEAFAAEAESEPEPEPQPSPDTEPAQPPTSVLERARTAYDEGDLDDARSYLDDVDEDDLDDDELEEFRELQQALDDE